MATIKVRGREATPIEHAEFLRSPFHRTESKDQGVVVGVDRAGGGPVEIADTQPDDLVELHLDDGSVVVTTYERFRERIDEAPAHRGADLDVIPAFLDLGDGERGAGTVALQLLRVFRVDPIPAIADLATRKAIAHIEGQLSASPGLYALDANGALGGRVSSVLADPGKPILVFLHGTASSTRGSFGGLFGARNEGEPSPTAEWRTLRDEYAGRIYALEHLTLSASPAENALELARLLPSDAELHLVSHSRGGLVGELLCRGGFDASHLRVFERDGRAAKVPDELAELKALGSELAGKRFRVERFVRVACPAAGTVLASDRLDLYLSVLLSVLRHAVPPGAGAVVELLKATLIEVARRRADPAELPGLEAQRPESPYAHFLNRPQAAVGADLTVIAGDLARGNVLQSLRAFAGSGLFGQKNDLVVHTRAMYAGLPRTSGWVSFHESAAVTHFSYFTEASSRSRLAAALLRPTRDARAAGFENLVEALAKQSFSVFREAPEAASKAPPKGTVLVVPDVFASRLTAGGTMIWPSAEAIARGGLGDIVAGAPGVLAAGLVDPSALEVLGAAFAGTRRIEPVPYDWRGGSTDDPAGASAITSASEALRRRLEHVTPADRPLAVVGHGLGALGVLELRRAVAASGEDLFTDVAVLLVAPPLDGSESLLQLCLGEGRLFTMLKCLDEEATASDIAGLFQRMRGVVELLPDRALEPGWWAQAGLGPPDPALLAATRERRLALSEAARADRGLAVLLGAAEATAAVHFTDRRRTDSQADGDGWMVNPTAKLAADRTWFAAALHERLLLHPSAAAAAADLLQTGATSRATRQPPPAKARRDAPPFIFPSQDDLVDELRAGDLGKEPAAEVVLHVRVAHGSLDRLARPLLIGHYAGDTISGAEKFLNRCLQGRLGQRHGLGNYPGPVGTACFVPAPGCTPTGAMVLGLGEVGEVTAGVLSRGVEAAVIEAALQLIEPRRDRKRPDSPIRLPIAALLIGTRGGQLSLRQSMVATLRGVLAARRSLESENSKVKGFVALDDLTFVELWSDVAIAAGHQLRYLGEDAGLGLAEGERIVADETLQILDGRRGNSRAYGSQEPWWRRIVVSEEGEGGGRRGLKFVTLGERSRVEERLVFTQRAVVDDLLAGAPKATGADDGALVNALFEALLPVPIKETIFEGEDLVLVVDQDSGRYPWELLARRMGKTLEPVVSRVRVVRQFRTGEFRETISPARTKHALVIGDPFLGDQPPIPPLDGARLEAQEVAEMLGAEYTVESAIRQGGSEIFQKFFLHDYRLVHIAAHGVYDAGDPDQSGVVIGKGVEKPFSVLSGAIFGQLRRVPEVVFLNCCHLGKLDAKTGARPSTFASEADRARLASSVAQAVMGLGVRCLVVAGWAVDDRAARDFAREFYRRLLGGEPFGAAVHEARCSIWKRHGRTTTWGAYQCYGDPAFELPSEGRSKTWQLSFVSAAELQDRVRDVVAASSAIGDSAEFRTRQRADLAAIETFLESHPDWRSGGLLYELAEAWKAAGDMGKAVERFRAALVADDARAPVRAAEQLSNLLDRLLDDGKTVEAAGLVPLEGARGPKRHAAAWLGWVDRLGETEERLALRGGMMKRAGTRARNEAKRRRLYGESAAAYARGLDLSRKRAGKVPYYQSFNVAALAWAAGEADERTIDELVTAGRAAAAAEREQGRTLWNAVADCDAELLDVLIRGTLDEAKANELQGRYREVLATLGTPTEHDSARKQIAFLASRAVAERAPLEPLFKIILNAFPPTKE